MRQSYSEQLQNPAWQRKRLEIFQRDKFICQLCLDPGTQLQIHHKAYLKDRAPHEYEPYYLVTLCKHCHAIVTELKINLFQVTPQVVKIKQQPITYIFFTELRGLSIYQAEPLALVGRFSHQTANKLTHSLINFWNQNDM